MIRRFYLIILISLGLVVAVGQSAAAQQFNTDNYLAMPHGTGTFIFTAGSKYSAFVPSFALFPNWEVFGGAFLYPEDPENKAIARFSTTLWAKYMGYENEAKNGGWAIAGGTGSFPGYLEKGRLTQSFRTYWISPMITVPMFNGNLIWDLNPGAVLNTDYSAASDTRWGFQYSTRAAVYGVIPKSAIVGEVFGTGAAAYVKPQYRVGVRWEPSPTFGGITASWSAAFDGSASGGFELGIIIYTPPFLCVGGCSSN